MLVLHVPVCLLLQHVRHRLWACARQRASQQLLAAPQGGEEGALAHAAPVQARQQLLQLPRLRDARHGRAVRLLDPQRSVLACAERVFG